MFFGIHIRWIVPIGRLIFLIKCLISEVRDYEVLGGQQDGPPEGQEPDFGQFLSTGIRTVCGETGRRTITSRRGAGRKSSSKVTLGSLSNHQQIFSTRITVFTYVY